MLKRYIQQISHNNNKIVLSLQYNGSNSYLYANGVQQLKFKTKDRKIKKIGFRKFNNRFQNNKYGKKLVYLEMLMILVLITSLFL